MHTAIGELNISSIDVKRGAVRVYCASELSADGNRLARKAGDAVKSLKDVIVISNIHVLEVVGPKTEEHLTAVARSYMKSFKGKVERIQNRDSLVGAPDVKRAMAVSGDSPTWHRDD